MDVLLSAGEQSAVDISVNYKHCHFFGNWIKETQAIKDEVGAGPVRTLWKGAELPFCDIPAALPKASFSWKLKSPLSLQGLEKTKLGQKSCPDCFSFWPEGWTVQMINKEATNVSVPTWKVKAFIYPERVNRNCSSCDSRFHTIIQASCSLLFSQLCI